MPTRAHEALAGSCCFAPRNSLRTFKNNTTQPVRTLMHNAPSGIEKFFDAAHAEFARPGGPDMNRATALAAEGGIEFVEA